MAFVVMIELLLAWFTLWPPQLTTVILASLPITELRAALPIALAVFRLDPTSAYIWTVIGNLIPIPVVYLFLSPLMRFVLRFVPVVHRRMEAYFGRLIARYGDSYSAWGAFFLFLFVAVPLPGTGAWTGSILAVLFHIKPTLAVPCIAGGVLVAGLIVLGITQGIFESIRFL